MNTSRMFNFAVDLHRKPA